MSGSVPTLGTDPLFRRTQIADVLLLIGIGLALASGTTDPLAMGWGVVSSFLKAVLIGSAAALLLLFLVNTVRTLPNAMVGVTAFVLITFGVAEQLGASGAIASLALGFTLSNREALGITRLRAFAHLEPRNSRALEPCL